MKIPEFDADGYPTEKTLDTIAEWDMKDFEGLMDYVSRAWHWDHYFKKGRKYYWLHTGGWSGNESIIGALKENQMFWLLCWVSSERGGHYKFELRKVSP